MEATEADQWHEDLWQLVEEGAYICDGNAAAETDILRNIETALDDALAQRFPGAPAEMPDARAWPIYAVRHLVSVLLANRRAGRRYDGWHALGLVMGSTLYVEADSALARADANYQPETVDGPVSVRPVCTMAGNRTFPGGVVLPLKRPAPADDDGPDAA
jgi:hypothetical protein